MGVSIRLMRLGSKHRPVFRVVVADSQVPTKGQNLDSLGMYDPLAKEKPIRIDVAQVSAWQGRGATISPSVSRLMKRAADVRTTE